MKFYLFAIFFFLNILSLKAQSIFSKDIFLEKTIYSVIDSIKGKGLAIENDLIFVNDATLRYIFPKVSYCRDTFTSDNFINPEQKDTLLNGIRIRAVRNLPYIDIMNEKLKKPKYFLDYNIKYATDSNIIIGFNFLKVYYKKRLFKRNYIASDLLGYYTFELTGNLNLRNSLKIKN